MNISPPKARLLSEIPTDRYRLIAPYEHIPKVGDIVQYDQSFSRSKGEPMGLVYGIGDDGRVIYEAEIHDCEADIIDPESYPHLRGT